MSRARRELEAAPSAESLFRTYFERLPEPAYIVRRESGEWRVLARNRAGAERTYGGNVVVGTVERLFPDNAEILEHIEACTAGDDVRACEADVHDAAGDVRHVALTFVPVDAETVVVHERDVTEERRSREALRESERHVRTLIRSNPELLIRVTGDGRYLELHAPPEDRGLLTLSPEEHIGRYVHDVHDPEFATQHAYYRRKVLEEGSVQFWQYARRTSEGGLVNLEARFVRSGEDEVLITVRDVGQRVEREREVVLSVERERNRIGQDLHDGLAQLLTGANLLLEPIKESLARTDHAQRSSLDQAVDLIKQAIGQTRELARGLSPVPQGHGFSLADALAGLARQSQDYFGLSCHCECKGPLPHLSTETSANLYRIAQEAITNAVKHGGARHVDLECRVVEGRLQLRVVDDGCGIGLDDVLSTRRGMGLNIMRYRARAIGAELAVGPAQEGGTVVECTVSRPPKKRRDASAGADG